MEARAPDMRENLEIQKVSTKYGGWTRTNGIWRQVMVQKILSSNIVKYSARVTNWLVNDSH